MYRITLIMVVLVLFAGCTTTRTNQFNEFADAGKAYVDAVEAVTEEAGNAAIDADSTLLSRIRDSLEYQDRVDTIMEHNKILKERLGLLRDIRRHGRILKQYFIALSNLSQSTSPEKIKTETDKLVQSLGTLGDDIKDAKIGNMAVSDFSGPAAKIIVTNIKVKLLEEELKKHAEIIERELDLQEAAFKLIVGEMKTDLESVLLNLESTEIVKPYIENKSLSSTWARKRKEILTTTVGLDSATAAARAAENLKKAFIALVENKFEFTHLDAIIADIEEIYVLIDNIITKEEEISEEE